MCENKRNYIKIQIFLSSLYNLKSAIMYSLKAQIRNIKSLTNIDRVPWLIP